MVLGNDEKANGNNDVLPFKSSGIEWLWRLHFHHECRGVNRECCSEERRIGQCSF